jgi:hypothetical protein
VVRSLTRVFNPLVMSFAGTRLLPLYGVITHHGRRSGMTFRTPVVVQPTAGGFVVPMPWGLGTDWYRNVRAEGGCVIRWKGRDYPMVRPEVVQNPAAGTDFNRFERSLMPRLGINYALRLHHRR